MSKKQLVIEVDDKAIESLIRMGAAANGFIHRRESGEPVYAQDMEQARSFANILRSFAAEGAKQFPAITDRMAREEMEKIAQQYGDKVGFINIGDHDCETCPQKGKCPIESIVRKSKEDQGGGDESVH